MFSDTLLKKIEIFFLHLHATAIDIWLGQDLNQLMKKHSHEWGRIKYLSNREADWEEAINIPFRYSRMFKVGLWIITIFTRRHYSYYTRLIDIQDAYKLLSTTHSWHYSIYQVGSIITTVYNVHAVPQEF